MSWRRSSGRCWSSSARSTRSGTLNRLIQACGRSAHSSNVAARPGSSRARGLPTCGGQDRPPVGQRGKEREDPGGAPVEPCHLGGVGAADLGQEPGQGRRVVVPHEVERGRREQLQTLPRGCLGQIGTAVADSDSQIGRDQHALVWVSELADADQPGQHLWGAGEQVGVDAAGVEGQLRQLGAGLDRGQAGVRGAGVGEQVPARTGPSSNRQRGRR